MHGSRSASNGDEPGDLAPLPLAHWPAIGGEGSASIDSPAHAGQVAICIAVDDFGLHAGINAAALRLAEANRAQAIGCMVGGPAWQSWNSRLRALDPARIDLGLHLDLTETPLLPGTRRSLNGLIRASFLHRLDPRVMRAEIQAQLNAFEQAIGRAPDYIDGHQHVHQFPIVRDALLAELAERYGGFKPWLRSTRRVVGAGMRAGARWPAALKPWLIQQLGSAGLASAATALGHPQNGRLLGVYDFEGGADHYARLIDAWLSQARQGDLLMCHPSAPIACDDPLIDARQAEFDVLCSPAFEAWRTKAFVVLEPMSRILSSPFESSTIRNPPAPGQT